MSGKRCLRAIAWCLLGIVTSTRSVKAETVNTYILNSSQTVSGEFNVIGNGSTSRFWIGATLGDVGALVIESGAAFNVSGTFGDQGVIGRNGGCGEIMQNGGLFRFGVQGRSLNIGASSDPATVARYWLNGGIMDFDAKSDLLLGYYGSGAYTSALIVAGGVITNLNKLHVGYAANSKADVMVTGGTIVIGAGGIQGKTPNGRIFLGGGTLAASANWTGAMPMTLTGENGPATLDTRGFTVTQNGLLSGPGALVKSGAGVLNLPTPIAHTAALSAQAGTLRVTVAAANARLACGSLALASGTVLDVDFQRFVPSATVAPLQVTGDLDLGTAPAITVRNGGWQAAGTYPLVTYTGTFTGTLPAAPAEAPAGVALAFTHDAVAKRISVAASPSAVTWDGTDNDWSSPHWLPGNLPGPYSALASVFITNGTVYLQASDLFGPNTVNWNTTVSPAIFLNSATLDSKSCYNTIWNLHMGDGATLRCNGGANVSAQSFQLAGTLTVTNLYGGHAPSRIAVADQPLDALNNVNIGGNGNPVLKLDIDDVTDNADADLEFLANIQDWNINGGVSNSLVKAGPGTLLLSGTNLFRGGVVLNEGTVAVARDAALGAGALTFASNATLAAAADVTLANDGVISNAATATVAVPEGVTLKLGGAVAGGGAATKTGAGKLLGLSGGSMAVPLTVASGTVGVSVTNTALPYTVASLAFAAPGTGLTCDFGALVPVDNGAAVMQVTGAVDFSTIPWVTLRAPNLGTLAAGTKITLLTWGSVIGTPPTAVTVDTLHPVAANLVVEGNVLKAVLTARSGTPPLRWSGAQSALWNTSDANWRDAAGNPLPFAQAAEYGDDVRLDDTYVASDVALTVTAAVSPFRVWAENTAYAYTLGGAGPISTGVFEKRGANNLTLNVPVTAQYVAVNGGTVTLDAAFTLNGIGTSSRFYIGDGAASVGTLTLRTNAVLAVNGVLADSIVIGRDGGSGSVYQNGGLFQANRPVYVGASRNIETRARYELNDGTLDVGQNLYIGFGNGVLITGAFHQTGGVVTNASLIQIGRGDGHGVYTLSGGTLAVMSGGLVTGSGNYDIELGGGTVLSTAPWKSSLDMTLTGSEAPVTFATGTNAVSLSGTLSGPGGLAKTGTGSLTLLGANTYAGVTRISQGTLNATGTLASCAITVDAGASFGGSGTLAWRTGQTLTVRGTANLSGFTLAIHERPPAGEHLVVDYGDGTLQSQAGFAAVTGLPPYSEVRHNTAARTITLKVANPGTVISIH